jgi:cytochrome c oxidase cbb3-type subunit 3
MSLLRQCGLGWAVFLTVTGAFASGAQEPSPAPSPTQNQENSQAIRTREFLGLGREPDAKSAARGAKLFGPTCGFCHGPEGRGGQGPDLLRSTVVLDDDKGELIGPVVHGGRVDKGMPAFASLTDEEVRDIAEFLHLQVELAANRGTYTIQNIVTGDARAGNLYFNGDGKCNTCHSVTGDLAHIGSKLDPPDLQQAFLYPDARANAPGGSRNARKVTVTLPDGKTLTGTLRHLDDFDVGLYDSGGVYHSIAIEKGVKVDVDDKLVFHRQMLDKYTDTEMHDLTAYLATLK